MTVELEGCPDHPPYFNPWNHIKGLEELYSLHSSLPTVENTWEMTTSSLIHPLYSGGNRGPERKHTASGTMQRLMAVLTAGQLPLTLGLKEPSKDIYGLREPRRETMKHERSKGNFLLPRAALGRQSQEETEQTLGRLGSWVAGPPGSSALGLPTRWCALRSFSSSLVFPARVFPSLSP